MKRSFWKSFLSGSVRVMLGSSICNLIVLLSAPLASAQTNYYVATNGNDTTGTGTSSNPFQTITNAYTHAAPGTTIIVEPGTYTDYHSGWGLHFASNGTASSPIVIKSQVRGGAIIDGQNASDRNVGIYLDGSYNIIDGFEVKNGPNGGISIFFPDVGNGGHGNQILNCEVDHNGNRFDSVDEGLDGIYEAQNHSNNVFAANYIHDNGRTGGSYFGDDHGLYLCGQNDVVINNVSIRNDGSGLQIAGYTTVSNMKLYNNVFAWNGTEGIIIWMHMSGVDIKNNICFSNAIYGIHFVEATGTGVVIDHNLIYGNGSGYHDDPGTNVAVEFDTVISSDPQFANETQSGFDANLTAGSPAIGAGYNFYSLFTNDLAGNLRPSSGAWDIGAYEYASVVSTNYYVATNGNDSNPGTSAQPFRTITNAYSRAQAGTTIIVKPGTYTDYTVNFGLHVNGSGTASSPIVLRSETRGAAIIDGQNLPSSVRSVGIYIDGAYNIVDGFQIKNGADGGLAVYGGQNNKILNCEIAYNGTNSGGSGIYESEDSSGNWFNGNYCHDNGIATDNGLDHGLYLSGDNDVVVNNVCIRNTGTGLQIAGYTTISNMKVYNNVFAWNGYNGLIVWKDMSGVDIKNNILYANAHWGIHFEAATGSGVVIDKNLIFGNGSGDHDAPTNDGGNLNPDFETTISSDPQFANDTQSGFDAHLSSGSPAIGAGDNFYSLFTTDLAGSPRASSGAWDIGAYTATNVPPGGEEFTNDANTIALYHFNGDYNDSSANGFNLTAFGNTTRFSNPGWMQNPSGEAVRFSDLGDQLVISTVPDSAVEPGPNQTPLTIEARIFPRAYKAYNRANARIVSLWQDYDSQFQIYDPIYPDAGQPINPPYVACDTTHEIMNQTQWQNAVSLNAWHKFKLTFAADGTAKCYIDDSLVNTIATSVLVYRTTPWTITLGNFDGDIDEVRISNIVR